MITALLVATAVWIVVFVIVALVARCIGIQWAKNQGRTDNGNN